MAQLQIDMSGRAGMVERYFGETESNTPAPTLRYISKDGMVAAGPYNPWAKYGYLTPSNNGFVSLTGTITAEIRAAVYDSASATLFFGENNARLQEIPITGTTATLDTTISGTTPNITDLEIYQINGVKKLFTAYNKVGGGGADVQINNIPYGTVNATWMSGTASGGFNPGNTDLFFVPADNGFMYMGDGNFVHKIDGTVGSGGTNGTVTANVLTFPAGFTLVDGIDYRGRTWFAVQTSSYSGSNNTGSNNERVCGVYVWDRQTTQVNMTDFIPLPGVREIRKIFLSPKGDLRIICIANSRLIQLRKFNGSYWGSTFDVIAEFGVNTEPVYRDGVDLLGGLTVWLGRDRKFYAYGSLTTSDPEASYVLGDSSALTNSINVGAIRAVDANLSTSVNRQGIYFNGSDTTVRKWYPNGTGTIDSTATGYLTTEIFYPVKWLPRMSTVKDINVQCVPSSTSDSSTEATIKIYINQSSTAAYTYTITRADITKGYFLINLNAPYVNSIQISITYPAGTQIGDYTFRPAFAALNYTPTTTGQ